MRIAIVGTGNVGGAIARGLKGKGHAVTLATRKPDSADVRALAEPVLRHRVLTNFHAEAEGVDSRKVITELLRETKA